MKENPSWKVMEPGFGSRAAFRIPELVHRAGLSSPPALLPGAGALPVPIPGGSTFEPSTSPAEGGGPPLSAVPAQASGHVSSLPRVTAGPDMLPGEAGKSQDPPGSDAP